MTRTLSRISPASSKATKSLSRIKIPSSTKDTPITSNNVRSRNHSEIVSHDSRTKSKSKPISTSTSTSTSKSTRSSRSKDRRSPSNILPPDLKLHTRKLEMALIVKDQDSSMWNATMGSNNEVQKQVYSFHSEHEAMEFVYANSPPLLVPFTESSTCFLCDGQFNPLRRRAMHCKNCGVCICKACSHSWSKDMVPESFNIKNSAKVIVCKTCDYLNNAFRGALTDGAYKQALKIYMTGNINLRSPFANVTPGMEVMYPVHCAASSGKMELVRWLIDAHKCPYQICTQRNRTLVAGVDPKVINVSSPKSMSQSSELIRTSNGRTILDIALERNHIDLLQYLVKEKKIALSSKNSSQDQQTLFRALGMILSAQADAEKSVSTSSSSSSVVKRSSSRISSSRRNITYDMDDVVRSNMAIGIGRKESGDDTELCHEIETCHEETFRNHMHVVDQIDKLGNQLLDFISVANSEESNYGDDNSSASEASEKKEPVWLKRLNNMKNDKAAQSEVGNRRLSGLKFWQNKLKSSSTEDTDQSEFDDTEPLICNFTCPVFCD